MKKKSCLAVIFVLAASIGVCMLTTFWVQKPKCDLPSLLLGEAEMPPGWREQWIILPAVLALDAANGARQAYSVRLEYADMPGEYGAHHTVYQYSNRVLSAFYFWLYYDRPVIYADWPELREASKLPLHADRIQIKCRNSNDPYNGNGCAAVLRYGFYISNFGSSIEEGVMTLDEFQEIIIKIDSRFVSCMN